jgi:hypothetical protein
VWLPKRQAEIKKKTAEATTNKGGGKAGLADRKGGAAGHAKFKCPICSMAAPDLKARARACAHTHGRRAAAAAALALSWALPLHTLFAEHANPPRRQAPEAAFRGGEVRARVRTRATRARRCCCRWLSACKLR